MALTGIQIFKLLPQTNCKECGVPTCLAFAMNLASGKAELDSCPYVSDEAKAQLSEASAPPIRPVAIGKGVRKFTTGGETVQYRHEKTFYNPTAFAAMVSSDISDEAAIAFSIGFYRALGAGKDIKFAFDLGINSVQLQGFAGDDIPKLIQLK